MESPSAFLQLSVPCSAGEGEALLWEGVHVLVITVAYCMTTNLLMWKQCLVFSCPINAFLCMLSSCIYSTSFCSVVCFLFVCVKYKSFNPLLFVFFFPMVLIDLRFLWKKSVLGIRVT